MRNTTAPLWSPFLLAALMVLTGCGGSSSPQPAGPGPLPAGNLNLIFVVSQDLTHHAAGDMNPDTANLTNQGLQRTLRLGTFLKESVLGGQNVTGIYALSPMTHLQTANRYPDIVALQTIQQFAMLNQTTIPQEGTANSRAIFASYTSGAVPAGVAPPVFPCPACQGLDFRDENGANEVMIEDIVQANAPGYYVFSAPWKTVSALMSNINALEGYGLELPSIYAGPNYVYALSVAPGGNASLVTYDSNLDPPSNYPVLPAGHIFPAACNPTFHYEVTNASAGAVIPTNINRNQTVHLVRHADAHPTPDWDDGNYIAAGQWRALNLPNALRGKIHPDAVYAIDPAIGIPGGDGSIPSSYVRPSLTVLPYAIANNLPFHLAAGVPVFAQNPPQRSTAASDFFFTGGAFSNQTLLVGWEHDHIPPMINALLASYNSGLTAPLWSDDDYDTIWTVHLDSQGSLTVDNELCEGIDSAALPVTAPQF